MRASACYIYNHVCFLCGEGAWILTRISYPHVRLLLDCMLMDLSINNNVFKFTAKSRNSAGFKMDSNCRID